MQQTGPPSLPANISVPSNGKSLPVTSWDRLHFSPLGAYHLRCWQGVFPGIKNFFITYQRRFRSADLAWFSSGSNRDGNHNHPQTSFHPSLVTLFRETNSVEGKLERKAILAEVKEQLFDVVRFFNTHSVYLRIILYFQATMYDRLTGGTTMIISSSGTTVPGSPTRPEYLKASVYLPPAFIAHHCDLHRHIIDIVQHFIETVGVRTVCMWTQRARRDLNYSLTQVGNPRQNALVNEIPSPEYNSAQYTFLGQPYRITDDPSDIPPVRTPSPLASADSYDFGEEPDVNTLTIIDLQQHNSELQDQIRGLEQQIRDLELQVNDTNQHIVSVTALLQRAHERIVFLEGQGQKIAVDRSTSTTPVQNKLVHSTPRLTPLKYQPSTPSRHTRPKIHSGTPSLSRTLPGTLFGSRLERASPARFGQGSPSTSQPALLDAIDSDELEPPAMRVLPHYINLYHLGHLNNSLDLIRNYTPAENRHKELLKLGLEEGICDALTVAMALDER